MRLKKENFEFKPASGLLSINWITVAPLCKQISRLNECLLEVEDLMEDQNLEVQQFFEPPRNNPLYQTVEDYKSVER